MQKLTSLLTLIRPSFTIDNKINFIEILFWMNCSGNIEICLADFGDKLPQTNPSPITDFLCDLGLVSLAILWFSRH